MRSNVETEAREVVNDLSNFPVVSNLESKGGQSLNSGAVENWRYLAAISCFSSMVMKQLGLFML